MKTTKKILLGLGFLALNLGLFACSKTSEAVVSQATEELRQHKATYSSGPTRRVRGFSSPPNTTAPTVVGIDNDPGANIHYVIIEHANTLTPSPDWAAPSFKLDFSSHDYNDHSTTAEGIVELQDMLQNDAEYEVIVTGYNDKDEVILQAEHQVFRIDWVPSAPNDYDSF